VTFFTKLEIEVIRRNGEQIPSVIRRFKINDEPRGGKSQLHELRFPCFLRFQKQYHPRVNEKFQQAIARFDEENSRDPNSENGRPRELLYAQRLTNWVLKLQPQASEILQLAARCQHICRWQSPRENYPMTRPGYLKWRADLKKFHAEKSGAILREVGYDDEIIRRVQELNLKKNFPADAEVRLLEDALCLVFLEFQFAALAAKSDDEKMINALKKSWAKMTEAARAEALKLNFGEREQQLIQRALAA
jgi:hypothetical protein